MWEVISDLRRGPGRGMERVERLADEVDLPVRLVRLATDFYCAFPDEIDARIEANSCTRPASG